MQKSVPKISEDRQSYGLTCSTCSALKLPYRSTVNWMNWCPNIALSAYMSPPRLRKLKAKLRRRSWHLQYFIPGFLFWTAAIVSSICSRLRSHPNWLMNTQSEIRGRDRRKVARLGAILILRSNPLLVFLKVMYPVSKLMCSHLRSLISSHLAPVWTKVKMKG